MGGHLFTFVQDISFYLGTAMVMSFIYIPSTWAYLYLGISSFTFQLLPGMLMDTKYPRFKAIRRRMYDFNPSDMSIPVILLLRSSASVITYR